MMRSKTWGWMIGASVALFGAGMGLAQDVQQEPIADEGVLTEEAVSPYELDISVPVPAGAVFRPYIVGVGEVEGAAAAEPGGTGTLVYSNRLGNGILSPGGTPGALVADDFSTTATGGCILDTLRFRVSGDPLGDGSGVGPYSVTFALYSACPSAGGFPLFTPVTENFKNNGNFEVIFKPATDITVPINGYFGVSFSRSLAGIRDGAPATLGFSADLYDRPGVSCDTNFGGFPGRDHGSFDLEITVRNDCPEGVCSSTCSGGTNPGGFCVRDDCPGGTCQVDVACNFGLDAGNPCTTNADCRRACVGGRTPGDECTTDAECENFCRGGSQINQPCTSNDDCPGSTCNIGICPAATCSRDECAGGANDGNICAVDDCPQGSCTGATACNGGTNADQACVYDCEPAFPAYKNSKQGGALFTSLPSFSFFADDIRLSVPVDDNRPCLLTSWEVAFKSQAGQSGAVQAELHTFLDNANPENGAGRISATRVLDNVTGPSVKIFRKTFADPILITQRDLFVVFKTGNSFAGAVRTCKTAAPGTTQDIYFAHDGSNWIDQGFPAPCIAAFEVSLSCAGAPPIGACCDMELTEGRVCIGGARDGQPCNRDAQCRVCEGGTNDGKRCDQRTDCPNGGICPPEGVAFCVGDAVCRDLPEINCAFPLLWREGESCGAQCDGGANHGESCLSELDCPAACSGGGRDGEACVDSSECPGTCTGGGNDGEVCFSNNDCRSNPFETFTCDNMGVCGSLGACRGQLCFGGTNHGLACSRSLDCPSGECGSSCMGGDNDGLACTQGSHCPGGICPAIPFPEPCGLGSCCTRNDLRCCVTEEECRTGGTPCGINDVPLETPTRYILGLPCDQGGCPRGACIAREGECTQARPGLCVGGTLNGTDCDITVPCFLDPCCSAGQAECDGQCNRNTGLCENGGPGSDDGQPCTHCANQPGCESEICCSNVCETQLSCCSQHWTQTCANIAFEHPSCGRIPANDVCFDPADVGNRALELPINSSVEVDLINATSSSSEPGLCCYRQLSAGGPGPGSQGAASVWLKTTAPATGTCRGGNDDGDTCSQNSDCELGRCRATVGVDTCNTTPTGDQTEDTIVQVFAVGDLDSGLCEDMSVCSVSLQNCFDGSTCVLNEQAACSSLVPIGCSDDASFEGITCQNSGGTQFPNNSDVCVEVVPGQPVYIFVAAKVETAKLKYRVTMTQFCTRNPPQLFNDLCRDAFVLGANAFGCDNQGNCAASFDLGGFNNSFADASFDCPGPGCLNTMQNDIWYDWIAPATGRLSADTCSGPATPDTSLALYDGCECPADNANVLSCSEFEFDAACPSGSRVSAFVEGGRCYKMRLGGHLGGTPGGTLDVNFAACPPGPIGLFDPLTDPQAGTIDARAPRDPQSGLPLGIDQFTIHWPGGTSDPFCYGFCETLATGFPTNNIFTITDNGNDTFTVALARPLAPGVFGRLTVRHGDGTFSHLEVQTLPGDADGNQLATSADLDHLVNVVNGTVPFNKYLHDMDHSGGPSPRDLLRWVDVTQGVSGVFSPWLNVPFPTCGACCPN